MLRDNIDTDAIIPSREMKTVSKHGLGEGLFAGWRYRTPGGREPDPAFILNQPTYRDASILLAGHNFGCGSSREHAVWALKEFGIRAIIASGFGSIFFGNCISNGLLPVVLAEDLVRELVRRVQDDPQANPVEVDLVNRIVRCGDFQATFELEDGARHLLLEGLDPIDATLLRSGEINAFEQQDREQRPWVYL